MVSPYHSLTRTSPPGIRMTCPPLPGSGRRAKIFCREKVRISSLKDQMYDKKHIHTLAEEIRISYE